MVINTYEQLRDNADAVLLHMKRIEAEDEQPGDGEEGRYVL